MRINNRPCKQSDRSFFLSLQADAKEYPGGIRALAEMIGVNPTTLANGLNPDSETQPPSFAVILEIIKIAQAKRAIFSLAQMVGQVPIDFIVEHRSASESVKLFMGLMHTVGGVIGDGSSYASDGRFDSEERKSLELLLHALLKSTCELLNSLRG